MNINIRILDHLITLFEIDQILSDKHDAVKGQRFADAVIILERQRELEKKLLTIDELKNLRSEIDRLQATEGKQEGGGQ